MFGTCIQESPVYQRTPKPVESLIDRKGVSHTSQLRCSPLEVSASPPGPFCTIMCTFPEWTLSRRRKSPLRGVCPDAGPLHCWIRFVVEQSSYIAQAAENIGVLQKNLGNVISDHVCLQFPFMLAHTYVYDQCDDLTKELDPEHGMSPTHREHLRVSWSQLWKLIRAAIHRNSLLSKFGHSSDLALARLVNQLWPAKQVERKAIVA